MVKCLIVDDEPLAREILVGYIGQTTGIELIKSCTNALEAFNIVSKEGIDLMFLDIKMPSISGIEFIKSLKNPPAVIFTTAFSEYAAVSYELEAVDYLLKPITYGRFSRSIARFFKMKPNPEPPNTYSYFKVDGKLVKLEHADIIYAQSVKDYVILKTAGKSYMTHMTMKSLVELLPETLFKRVHRSFLIGTTHITAIGKNSIELGTVKVPVGDNYKKNFTV